MSKKNTTKVKMSNVTSWREKGKKNKKEEKKKKCRCVPSKKNNRVVSK
jgi:hypothetical protein